MLLGQLNDWPSEAYYLPLFCVDSREFAPFITYSVPIMYCIFQFDEFCVRIILMKVNKLDKKTFKKFKNNSFPFKDAVLFEGIYSYLRRYIKQVLKIRFKGIYVYGFSEIKLSQCHIDDYMLKLESVTDETKKEKKINYLSFAKNVAKLLNKYVTEFACPAYKPIMKNYKDMIETLHDAPWFHDAYVVNCKKEKNDLYIVFTLYATAMSNENSRIYNLNPDYRGKDRTILITIKFSNVELIKGSLDKAYMQNRNYNFLFDLEYESISESVYQFNLFTVEGYELIFNCRSIEFIESRTKEKIFREIENLILGQRLGIEHKSKLVVNISDYLPFVQQTKEEIFEYIDESYDSARGVFLIDEEEMRRWIAEKYDWISENNIRRIISAGKYIAWHG